MDDHKTIRGTGDNIPRCPAEKLSTAQRKFLAGLKKKLLESNLKIEEQDGIAHTILTDVGASTATLRCLRQKGWLPGVVIHVDRYVHRKLYNFGRYFGGNRVYHSSCWFLPISTIESWPDF